MNVIEYAERAVDELKDNIANVDNDSMEKLISLIFAAKKIYVAACGRSRLMISAFAMRLMHLGFEVYVVGEIVTPAVAEGDLVIFCSGSGKTASLINMASKARSIGATVTAITIYSDSELAQLAEHVLQIGGRTSKVASDTKTIQPGGNVFEQSVLILMDCLIVRIAEVGQIDISKYKRHANLE